MVARTKEQNEVTRLKEELTELQAQFAFLGGLVLGAIHNGNVDGLDRYIDHFPYLQTLESFRRMRRKPEADAAKPNGPEGGAS